MNPPSSIDPRTRRRSLLAASFGNTLEWYEWSIYGVFTPFIAMAMFDSEDKVSALLAALGVFAAGFLMRPLGGIFFGRLADRVGRKAVLVTTLLLMGAGCFATGLAPTFDQVGVWASMILLLARLVQGFAHGGESAAATTYIAELGPDGKRGLWSSAYFAALLFGTVVAVFVGLMLILAVGEQAVAEGAWRYPFLLGGVLAIVVLFLRRGMHETEAYETYREEQADQVPASGPKQSMLRPAITVMALICGLTVSQYTWLSYVLTHAIVHTGMSAKDGYLSMIVAMLIAMAFLPLWGKLSDRIGRRPMFIGFAVVFAVLHFPLMNMINSKPSSLMIAASIALVVITSTGAIQSTTMAELFPTRSRSLGIGLAFSLSVAIFGGTAPYLNEWFDSMGAAWVANLYVVIAVLVTGVAAWFMPEGKNIDMANVGQKVTAAQQA
ncbi:MAG TPA: MFS transporter [Aldersonia sp.]